jgi:hypothetical protein
MEDMPRQQVRAHVDQDAMIELASALIRIPISIPLVLGIS